MQLAIELTSEERSILERIKFDQADVANPTEHRANGDAVILLVRSFDARAAIPAHRSKYFTDASYNTGGHGRSHREIFEKNGCHGEAILRHAHFLPYLRYMLLGADLPEGAISEFVAAVVECGQITSGDAIILSGAAKKIARSHYRDRRSAEEFFKLALDAGLDTEFARGVRDAVGTIR